jgi:hypothetical protein
MSLQQQIDQDIKTAMLAKAASRLRGLRAVKAALLVAKTEKGGSDVITEEVEVKVLQRLVKQRKEAADIYKAQNRDDLYQIEIDELEVIETYLPKQLDQTAVEECVKRAIAQSGASSMKDMGKVMGIVNAELAGKADGKLISETVKTLLAS